MEKLGHYEILGELGRGGCGVVYRALDPALGRTVAIKTILSGGAGDSSRERFRREARSAGGLSHPNIVTIHEFNDSGDVMFIAMEYIDGQTLAERMSQPKLPIPFVLSTVRSAADALDFAHASNIVHRDVKPANFLITKKGHLKITDFGIAKVLDSDASLTNTGTVIGTVQYMSPEQIAAQEVTGRSDQFSLAVIAYEMLTGQRPFQGNSWASVIHSIMANEPPPLNQHREDLGDDATAVLRKALAKDPAARYETCREFADALERSILGVTAEQRVFWEKASVTQPLPAADSNVTALMTSVTSAVTTTKEKTAVPLPATPRPVASSVGAPVAPRRPWVMPLVAGAVVAIGLGSWMVALHLRHSQDAAQLVAGSPSSAQPVAGVSPASGTPVPVAPQSQTPQSGSTDSPAPKNSSDSARGAKVERSSLGTLSPVKQDRTSAPAVAAATPTGGPAVNAPSPQPTEVTNSVAPATPTAAAPSQSAPATWPVETPPTPVTPPAPAAPLATPNTAPPAARGPDPAQAAAQRHAAELQAANRAIADTIARYRQAFEARDLDGLKAIWPSLGRNEQSSFQNFFRMVRSVKLEMTPAGEPEITASGAVAQYRRVISGSDERRALPTQAQTVKVTFRKSGDRMFIDAIEAVGR
jgi:serine/threonine protein kinase